MDDKIINITINALKQEKKEDYKDKNISFYNMLYVFADKDNTLLNYLFKHINEMSFKNYKRFMKDLKRLILLKIVDSAKIDKTLYEEFISNIGSRMVDEKYGDYMRIYEKMKAYIDPFRNLKYLLRKDCVTTLQNIFTYKDNRLVRMQLVSSIIVLMEDDTIIKYNIKNAFWNFNLNFMKFCEQMYIDIQNDDVTSESKMTVSKYFSSLIEKFNKHILGELYDKRK